MNTRAIRLGAIASSLTGKLALALVSVISYLLIGALGDQFDAVGSILSTGVNAYIVAGVLFAGLVMAPYAGDSRFRVVRVLAMCAASSGIYWCAVEFVGEESFQFDSVVSYLIAGGASALLTGLAVVLLAPRRLQVRLMALTLVAGAAGGATFDLDLPEGWFDEWTAGHLAWQLLVCAALHFGLAPARPAALP